MKALLDLHLSPRVAQLLRARGFEVDSVSERHDLPDSTPDADLLAIAADERRVMVTSDIKDFRHLAAQRLQDSRTHHGLIFVTSARLRTVGASAVLADAIETILREDPDGLDGGERWIGD